MGHEVKMRTGSKLAAKGSFTQKSLAVAFQPPTHEEQLETALPEGGPGFPQLAPPFSFAAVRRDTACNSGSPLVLRSGARRPRGSRCARAFQTRCCPTERDQGGRLRNILSDPAGHRC